MFRQISLLASIVIVLSPIYASAQYPFLVKQDATWHYRAATGDPDADWSSVDFDTKRWPQGRAGFGYGDDDDATVITNMMSRFARLQIRTEFEIADLENVSRLYLYVNYDDGFVAYINGKEVTRCNVDDSSGGLAAHNHEVAGFEEFVVPNAKTLLKRGRNVLAIEGFNRSIASSDFSLHPVLSALPEANLVGLLARVTSPSLATRTVNGDSARVAKVVLSRDQAIADIDELQRRIEDQSSYVRRDRFDREEAFDRLRASIQDEVTVFELGEKLERLIARIGDGHARADVAGADGRASYLPFTLADTDHGIAALKVDRSALIDNDCPYVLAIDGVPLDRWLDVARTFVADGSPQLIRHRAFARIRRIDLMRRYLEVPASSQATISLRSLGGGETHEHNVKLSGVPSPVGRVPIARTRMLDDNIGYLRIEKMDNSLQKAISKQMGEFRGTSGLIIDVRDNGGGRYGILHLLHGYLTPPDAEPYVTNVAAYRKSRLFSPDHIHYRPTFRESYDGWNDRQLAAIREAREKFDPEWTPPRALFSDWHYMVIDKTPNVGRYHYDGQVVVLCNAGSFSATDGFLSGMADIPGVVLLGEPSGGGSGATRRFNLAESGIRIALSSMASFRSNGKLFDGNGVEVDIEMKPTISDFMGKSDTVRTRAIELITTERN